MCFKSLFLIIYFFSWDLWFYWYCFCVWHRKWYICYNPHLLHSAIIIHCLNHFLCFLVFYLRYLLIRSLDSVDLLFRGFTLLLKNFFCLNISSLIYFKSLMAKFLGWIFILDNKGSCFYLLYNCSNLSLCFYLDWKLLILKVNFGDQLHL